MKTTIPTKADLLREIGALRDEARDLRREIRNCGLAFRALLDSSTLDFTKTQRESVEAIIDRTVVMGRS